MTAPDELLVELLDALGHLVAAFRARQEQAAQERAAYLAELLEAPALGSYRRKGTDGDVG